MMSARNHINFQQVMIPETLRMTEEGNMRKEGMSVNLGMTHLRKAKPSSLSRHKPQEKHATLIAASTRP